MDDKISKHLTDKIEIHLEYINSASYNNLYRSLKLLESNPYKQFYIDEDDQVFTQKIQDLNLLIDNVVDIHYITEE